LGAGEPLGRVRVKGLAGDRLHVENRVPCGASNPYLVGAAGLDGIRNHTEPPPETEGLAYGLDGPVPIPTRLEAAWTSWRRTRCCAACSARS